MCGILFDKYIDFYQFSFGISIIKSPDYSEIRQGGRTACNLANYCESDKLLDPFEFSKIIYKDIYEKLIFI